jgi:hypothetical protein
LSGRRVKPRILARIAGIRRRVLLDFWFGFSLLKQIAAAVISPPCAAPRCRFSDRSSRSVSPSFVSDWSVLNLETAGRTRLFTSSRILHPRVRLPTPRFARGAPLLDLDSCSTETPRLVFLCRFLRSSSRFHFDFSRSAPGGLDESPLQRLGSWGWTAIFFFRHRLPRARRSSLHRSRTARCRSSISAPHGDPCNRFCDSSADDS